MNNLKEFIIEKLKINKDSKSNNTIVSLEEFKEKYNVDLEKDGKTTQIWINGNIRSKIPDLFGMSPTTWKDCYDKIKPQIDKLIDNQICDKIGIKRQYSDSPINIIVWKNKKELGKIYFDNNYIRVYNFNDNKNIESILIQSLEIIINTINE